MSPRLESGVGERALRGLHVDAVLGHLRQVRVVRGRDPGDDGVLAASLVVLDVQSSPRRFGPLVPAMSAMPAPHSASTSSVCSPSSGGRRAVDPRRAVRDEGRAGVGDVVDARELGMLDAQTKWPRACRCGSSITSSGLRMTPQGSPADWPRR